MAIIIITKKGQRFNRIDVSQKQIAEECGITAAAVSQMFAGKIPLPSKYKPIMIKHKVPLRIFKKRAA
jgi:predicted transcriptional regulator